MTDLTRDFTSSLLHLDAGLVQCTGWLALVRLSQSEKIFEKRLDKLLAGFDFHGYDMSAQGTVLCALGQSLLNLRIIPVLIPVSLDACRIDTPPFSTFRSAGSCSTQRTVPCVPENRPLCSWRTVPCVPGSCEPFTSTTPNLRIQC